MIDLDDMMNRQQEGLKLVDSLQEEEFAVLRHYCSLTTEVLMDTSAKRQFPVDKIVINALKHGVALGLRLQIAEGEIRGRL